MIRHNSHARSGRRCPIAGFTGQQPDGATMVPRWCHDGATMVPRWCHDGATMVPRWCHDGAAWCHQGATWYQSKWRHLPPAAARCPGVLVEPHRLPAAGAARGRVVPGPDGLPPPLPAELPRRLPDPHAGGGRPPHAGPTRTMTTRRESAKHEKPRSPSPHSWRSTGQSHAETTASGVVQGRVTAVLAQAHRQEEEFGQQAHNLAKPPAEACACRRK